MDLRENRLKGLAATAGAMLMAGLAGLLSGCASGSGPTDAFKQLTARDYGRPYIGMSKAEVLSCAGQPRSRLPASESAETLVYHYSGAGPVPAAAAPVEKKSGPFGGSKKKTPQADAECTASLVFENDRLVRVSYAHVNVRSPYDWQSEDNEERAAEMRREGVPTCTFSLPRCPR